MGEMADYYLMSAMEDWEDRFEDEADFAYFHEPIRPPKRSSYGDTLYYGNVAGVSFSPAKDNIQDCISDEPELGLVHTRNNIHDANAISVRRGCRKHIHMGWVPKEYNKEILKYGLGKVVCEFKKWNWYKGERVGFNISITKKGVIDG